MKRTAWLGVMLMVVLTGTVSAAVAAECSGAWRVLPNYRGGGGGPCAAIGLNTHQAVCQPGQRYATYCDDASGGRYRTCQSSIPCYRGGYGDDDGYRDRDDWRDDRRGWRYDRREDHHDWRDSRRDDYRHERRNYGFDCTRWDYQANRPCPPGTVNRDCRNDCGRIW